MKRISFFISTVFLTINMMAQNKYVETYQKYVDGEWEQIAEEFTLKPTDKNNVDFILRSKEKETKKMLDEKAALVFYQDSLYVNLTGVSPSRRGWFVRGYPMDEYTILFTDFQITPPAFYGGVNGVAIPVGTNVFKNPTKLKNRTCFIVAIEEENTDVYRVTHELMEEWLIPYPAILEEYKNLKKNRKEDADIILDCLSRAGIIKK